jgi:hypothetical protein
MRTALPLKESYPRRFWTTNCGFWSENDEAPQGGGDFGGQTRSSPPATGVIILFDNRLSSFDIPLTDPNLGLSSLIKDLSN